MERNKISCDVNYALIITSWEIRELHKNEAWINELRIRKRNEYITTTKCQCKPEL